MAHNPALYHPKWTLIRRLVLKRAGHACEWCTARDRQPHHRTGSTVHLAVAHVDRNRRHNRFSNLAALCERCHLAHDSAQHIYNRRAGRDWADQQQFLNFPPCELAEAVSAGRAVLLPRLRYAVRLQARPLRCYPRPQLPLPYSPPALLIVAPLSPTELAQRRALQRSTALPALLRVA